MSCSHLPRYCVFFHSSFHNFCSCSLHYQAISFINFHFFLALVILHVWLYAKLILNTFFYKRTYQMIFCGLSVCLCYVTAACLHSRQSWIYTVVHKNVPLLFFDQLRQTLADFNNFWHATSGRNLTQMTTVLTTSL